MGQIILARPGKTDFDDQQRFVGVLDIPLNAQGRAEVDQLATELAEQSVGRVYAASGEAAEQSAKRLAEKLHSKVKVVDDLHNFDLGLWQGLVVDDVKKKHPRLFRQWEETPQSCCPPAGEALAEAQERVKIGLKKIVKRAQDETVVLFAPDPVRCIIRCQLQNQQCPKIWGNGNGRIWEAIRVG